MNAYLRTLPLPGAVRPVREHGASALDRVVPAWPAPDPAARVLDRWGMPPQPNQAPADWPAPDPVMRFDLPAPDLSRAGTPTDGRIPWTDLVEPHHAVTAPDLHSASLAAVASPVDDRPSNNWPPPVPATAAAVAPASTDRSRFPARVVVGLAAAAGALVAGAAVLTALF